MKKIALNTELRDGWVAKTAQLRHCLALITLMKRGEENRFVRLDLAKQIFIDAPPGDLRQVDAELVAVTVASKLQANDNSTANQRSDAHGNLLQ